MTHHLSNSLAQTISGALFALVALTAALMCTLSIISASRTLAAQRTMLDPAQPPIGAGTIARHAIAGGITLFVWWWFCAALVEWVRP